jgi:hypothetical protein
VEIPLHMGTGSRNCSERHSRIGKRAKAGRMRKGVVRPAARTASLASSLSAWCLSMLRRLVIGAVALRKSFKCFDTLLATARTSFFLLLSITTTSVHEILTYLCSGICCDGTEHMSRSGPDKLWGAIFPYKRAQKLSSSQAHLCVTFALTVCQALSFHLAKNSSIRYSLRRKKGFPVR